MSPAVIDYAIKMFCCVFAAGTLVYVFLPTRDTETGVVKTRVVYLYERKEVIYENLRDLNFEFKSGKFAQDDYDGMRVGLEAEAARVLAEIESLESVKA
ncbi:MAG TPA: hypothetical protein VHA06_13475 [Candidatus Angelobacter sp.]|jgi:hypothetical protein|nr:hypothetical protein [Candidatus Angelobacter sp.]